MNLRCIPLAIVIATAGVVCSSWTAFGDPQAASPKAPRANDDEQSPKDANKWMHIKLHASQEIFAAMTRGDAKAIETNARRMLLVNVMEQWIADKPYMIRSEYD